ncbi:MAG: hypothetical protein ACOYYU_10385 [Chloroflexota bacterium]
MTAKIDTRALKAKHRLELVMQETGERFEADAANPELWRGKVTPGLTVDTRRQSWEVARPGLESKSGDVIAWLRDRYSWSFPQAIRFLQNRPPDPIPTEAAQPARVKTIQAPREDDESQPLDRWQEKALEIAGERIRKYFSWSWYSLAMYLEETRIEPTHAPGETICPRCEKRIDWQVEKVKISVEGPGLHGAYRLGHVGAIPVLAYSIKHRLNPSEFGIEDEALCEVLGGLFVEEDDGVICAECAWREYDFQIALELVKTSAYRRSEAEAERQRKSDHEAWLEAEAERVREQERQEREAEYACYLEEQKKRKSEAAPPV